MVHYKIQKFPRVYTKNIEGYTGYNILGYTESIVRYTEGILKVYCGILTMDGGEEAANEVLVEAPILAHFIDLLPLSVRHVLLDRLRTHLLPRYVPTTKLQYDWSIR